MMQPYEDSSSFDEGYSCTYVQHLVNASRSLAIPMKVIGSLELEFTIVNHIRQVPTKFVKKVDE